MASSKSSTKKPRLDPSNWSKGSNAQKNLFGAMGTKQPAPYPQLSVGNMMQASANANTVPASGAAAGAAAAAGGKAAANALGGTGSINGCTAAQTASNQKLGQQLAAVYGWGSGSEWTALNNVVMAESGWCNNAQNPGSTAYGIGQFLSGTWATVGGSKTNNPTIQIKLMLAYIKMTYGTPSAAWSFHVKNGWY